MSASSCASASFHPISLGVCLELWGEESEISLGPPGLEPHMDHPCLSAPMGALQVWNITLPVVSPSGPLVAAQVCRLSWRSCLG